MKRTLCCALACLLLFALVSCGTTGYVTVKSVESRNANGFSMRYEKFDGVKRETVTVKEGTTMELKVSVTTEAGTLAISVEHKDGTVAYRGTELPSSEFSVVLSDAGTYTVTLTAEDHRGAYAFSWD
ncbi:MAG: PKD domain-containing protein [Eubacteriales bacterium]